MNVLNFGTGSGKMGGRGGTIPLMRDYAVRLIKKGGEVLTKSTLESVDSINKERSSDSSVEDKHLIPTADDTVKKRRISNDVDHPVNKKKKIGNQKTETSKKTKKQKKQNKTKQNLKTTTIGSGKKKKKTGKKTIFD